MNVPLPAAGPSPPPPSPSPVFRAARAAVLVSGGLAALKLVTYGLTHSVGVLSSAVDSSLDLIASLLFLIAIRHAHAPPDEDHRFGHGKIEGLTALAQAAFVLGSAGFVAVEGVRRLFSPQLPDRTGVGIGVMAISIVATLLLVIYQARIAQSARSVALRAEIAHYASDLGMNAAVIIGLLLGDAWPRADALAGLLVAAIIIAQIGKIGRAAIDELMDRELPDADRAQIAQAVQKTPGVQGFHDLRTRTAGPRRFIELHLELDGRRPLAETSAIANAAAANIAHALPGADVIIHQEPAEPDEPAT